MMIEFFSENPLIVVAIMVFVVCFIIGFFGDMYLRNNNKIGKLVDFKNDIGHKSNGVKENIQKQSEPINVAEEQKKHENIVSNNQTDINNANLNTINERDNNNNSNDMTQNQINKLVDKIPTNNVMNTTSQRPAFFDGNAQNDDGVNNVF